VRCPIIGWGGFIKNNNMEKITVNVICQYQENYGFHDGGEHWKNKGGVVFSLEVDYTQWVYDDTNCKQAIERVISSKNNQLVNYKVVQYDTIIDEPISITEEFNSE
jgi:hypothetical protein